MEPPTPLSLPAHLCSHLHCKLVMGQPKGDEPEGPKGDEPEGPKGAMFLQEFLFLGVYRSGAKVVLP